MAEKLEMLETLLEIEVATNIVKEEKEEAHADMDPFDIHYNALHAEIRPLDPKCAQYQKILKAVKTTHAETHSVDMI